MTPLILHRISLALVVCMLLNSCAAVPLIVSQMDNRSTKGKPGSTADARRTKTDSTLLGSAAGAGLGAIFGRLTGLDPRATAAVGAILGGALGYKWGSNVAAKKAEFARKEDFLAAASERAARDNKIARSKNKDLEADIKKLEGKSIKLASGSAEDKQELKTVILKTKGEVSDLDGKIKDRVSDYQKCLQGPGYGNKTESAELKQQITDLESEKAALQKYQRRLAAAQTRVAI